MLYYTIRSHTLNLAQFKKVVTLIVESTKEVEDCKKYIKEKVFDKHNELVYTLLESIYDEKALSYILYEWLLGNTSPLKVKIDENTELIYEVETIEDLWKAMELYKKS